MLEHEEAIVTDVTQKFPEVTGTVQRERRVWLESPRAGFLDLLTYLRAEHGCISLLTVTGLDAGETFQLLYSLAGENGVVVCARVSAPADDPVFDTASDIYKNAILPELEARNLLGLTIHGIPEDIRYPLPDNWPEGQYPLRKSWVLPGSEEAAAPAKGAAAGKEEGNG